MSPLILVGLTVLLAGSLEASKDTPQDYWWMASNSPFKQAVDNYKKCSLKGNCGPKDIAPEPAPAQERTVNLKNNPFLNGEFEQQGGFRYNSAGERIPADQGGFLGVQPTRLFGAKKSDKKPLQANGVISGKKLCQGVCVKPESCKDGVLINGEGLIQIRQKAQACQQGEVCCNADKPEKIQLAIPALDQRSKLEINNLEHITAGKSSVIGSTVKFSGGAGLSPGSIRILTDDKSLDPQIIVTGESGQHSASTVRTRDVSNYVGSSTIDYSDVVVGDDVRFSSNIQAPGYLPPVTTCLPGQIKTPSGACINPPPPPPPVVIITCAPGQIKTPSGACINPPPPPPPVITCLPGQIKTPSGACINPPPPPPPPPVVITCGPGQIKTHTGACINPPPPPPPPVIVTCLPGQIRTPSGGCFTPTPPPPPPTPVIITCAPGQIKTPSGCINPPPPPPPIVTCAPGQIKTQSGACVYPPSPPPPVIITCGPGQIKTPSGACINPPPPPPPSCPPGQIRTASGGCGIRCDDGTVVPAGQPCSTDSITDYEIRCPPGQERKFGKCVPPTTPPGYLPPPERDEVPEPGNENPVRIPPPQTGEKITDSVLPNCAAALKCVQAIYCGADGVVSATPVILTKEQELLRVPTTECAEPETNTPGVCCRDPTYKDPWPSANLVNGVDDGQYKEDNHFGESTVRRVRANKPARSISNAPNAQDLVIRQPVQQSQCGLRNENSQPKGLVPIDADFAEITWQAMILRDSNRSLLCGGAIIRPDAVLTTAHCVEGLDTSDILIKGGEWKLGIDEEPLPFQIVKVAAIVRHPQYKHGSRVNDLAVLKLSEKLRIVKNVGTICLPPPNQIPTQNCIATGWGKRILQLHAKNALMHRIEISIMDAQQCQQTLTERFKEQLEDYSPNTLCGFSAIDQCRVDIGSALACQSDDGRYVLSGIFAWDTGCKQDGQIGGYVAPDVDWIDQTLSRPLADLKKLDREYSEQG